MNPFLQFIVTAGLVVLGVVALLVLSACMVSSRISREEELELECGWGENL